MESEEITKMVDGVYKNILEKFNPGARQLISAGKGYLKALHGASSASRLFNEALAKIALNAQQSGTSDIGAALLNVVSVYKEIQDQQMNILKAFYVDLLVPLETNLEKDTKVVQHEQKKFLQQHKVRMESYQKAVTTMKKQRKKKASPENNEKELRSIQILEDQKRKLDNFCEQSYKNAMTQERRRYGFVLERQCSIAKHWMAYHSTGRSVIDNNLENWQEIAASREVIPTAAYENSFSGSGGGGNRRMERIKDADDSHIVSSQLKKSRSVDAPYGDMRTLHETNTSYSQNSLPRAKSDFNLTTSATANDHIDHGQWDQRPVVKALYAYMPSGENQLPFEEGDRIALVGSKAKGWQFGENVRTQMFGWFPIAYTNAEVGSAGSAVEKYKAERGERSERSERYENIHYERNGGGSGAGSAGMRGNYQDQYMSDVHMDPAMESDSTYRRRNNSAEESSPTRMFGDTINFRNQKKYRASSGANPRPGPPPTLPAPVPSGSNRILNTSQSFCAPNGAPSVVERRKHKLQNGPQAAHNRFITQNKLQQQQQTSSTSHNQLKPAAAAKTSLHSSNDSGFANEPPPQPEVDYSDEEQTSRVPIRRRADTNSHISRDVTSWTLNRNFRNSVDSQIDDKSLNALSRHSAGGKMRYDLIASDDEILQASSGGIKRTKSFWKFGGRSEEILAGMSLWQHRDLVAAPNLEEMRDDGYQRKTSNDAVEREGEREHDKNGTLVKTHSNNSTSSNEKRRKDSITSIEAYDEDENIYGMSPVVMRGGGGGSGGAVENRESSMTQPQNRNSMQSMSASFTPKSRMKIMKTIEIDIENPMEGERLSTIKRGQKEYRADAAMLQQAAAGTRATLMREHEQQQHQHQSKKQQQAGIGMQQNMHGTRNGLGGNHKKSNDAKQSGSSAAAQPRHHNQQLKSQQVPQISSRSKPTRDILHSTEDEGDSDENGTLKMSDVNNFFDDSNFAHDNSIGGMSSGGGAGGMIMKTVKRKDILKQYYTSEDESDEVEIKSTSSDPYDCIVINDHLVRSKDEKLRRQMHHNSYQEHQMEFQTFRAAATTPMGQSSQQQSSSKKKASADVRSSSNGVSTKQKQQQQQREQEQQDLDRYNSSTSTLTRNSASNSVMNTPTATILPRTRLMKSSNITSMTLERSHHKSRHNDSRDNGASGGGGSDKDKHFGKTYGPWYDFWDQQDQHTLVSQKAMNSKM